MALAAAVCLAAAAPAAAHARLLRSDPPDLCRTPDTGRPLPVAAAPCDTGPVLSRAPRVVRLWFNEPVALVGRGVRIFGPEGRRADAAPARAAGPEVSVGLRAGGPGTYLVVWRVIAQDTHPAAGVFPFSIIRPSPRTSPRPAARSALGLGLEAAARAVHFAGFALAVGVFVFSRSLGPGVAASDADAVRSGLAKLVGAGVLLLLAAEPIALAAQAVSLSGPGDPPFVPDLIAGVLDSSFGRVLAQRAGAAVALWVLLGVLRASPGRGALTFGILALGAALGVIDAQAAHAPAVRPLWLGFVANGAHMLAMALWLGALAGVIAIVRLQRSARRLNALDPAAGIVRASLAALVVAGAVLALQHLSGLRDLVATAYGGALAAKLCAFAVALACAAAGPRAALPRRNYWRYGEAVALTLALVLAALLVSLPPPR